jgi:hypothetical protein
MGVLMLKDPGREINLQTFTQLIPVPSAVVALARDDTPSDYPLLYSGLAVTIGSLMARNLQVSDNIKHAERWLCTGSWGTW